MGRRGWDGGKHWSPGIPTITPYQIPQASKSCFSYILLLAGEISFNCAIQNNICCDQNAISLVTFGYQGKIAYPKLMRTYPKLLCTNGKLAPKLGVGAHKFRVRLSL